jgi:predicted transcriptional regulator
METLSIKVPKQTKLRLKAVARARKTTPSTLMKAALDQVMEGSGKEVSFYDTVADLVERCEGSGIPDLATNKKHLEGLGR